ncbi:transketolase [Autumnicola musiva]|uniref:Transketolase n=1 Tax=Autumnicola musiva TaxID=3075589 RepID=A0ABU3D7X4_9FLAO|nr:transketolase [Zunongwangia sp. F117]MDT0677638.1 transketolase [Zunongwangia sp. F117]
MTKEELEKKAIEYRKKILTYIKQANAGHTGGSLSCIDVLNVLYNDVMNVGPSNIENPNRDRYIQSKGHSVEALFVVLADKGFYPESGLETLCRYKSHFVGHPTRKIPGVEQNTGALGHGLAISSGVALAGKKDKLDYKVYTLLGDGELAEGSNWEAALIAAQYKLDNLVAIVDHNGLQITNRTINVCSTDPLDDKFRAFGWEVIEVDGHDFEKMKEILNSMPLKKGKPSLVIANTIKGKGISFMEDQLTWHHRVPSDEEFQTAMKELDKAEEILNSKTLSV